MASPHCQWFLTVTAAVVLLFMLLLGVIMAQSVFINLPVADLAASRAFYTSLGYSINENFSDETAASVVISDTIYVMLLTHEKMAGFTALPIGDATKETQHLIALNLESQAAVDSLLTRGLAAGGTEPRPAQDYGFMYSRALADPDGHVWEPFWMDPVAVAGGPEAS